MTDRPSHRQGARRGRRAFTLIEILATLALVAIVLPAVVNGILLSLAAAGHARQQTEAAWLAQSKLAEIVATGDLDDSQLTGDFGPDWPEYQWSSVRDDWDDSRLYQLDVQVTWTRRNQERSVMLTTLVSKEALND